MNTPRSGNEVANFLANRDEVTDCKEEGVLAPEINAYCKMVDETIFDRKYGPSLFRISPEILVNTESKIFSQTINGETVCALHITPDVTKKFDWLNGLVKKPNAPSGTVRQLIARTFNYIQDSKGPNASVMACFRIFPKDFIDPTGRKRLLNEASMRLFVDTFDMDIVGIETVEIKKNFQDRHLVESAEESGFHFKTMKVVTTKETFEISRWFVNNTPIFVGRS